jgi:antitoxin (DNA-binding transcriptional repressor) of toxin-antitoxin stability system
VGRRWAHGSCSGAARRGRAPGLLVLREALRRARPVSPWDTPGSRGVRRVRALAALARPLGRRHWPSHTRRPGPPECCLDQRAGHARRSPGLADRRSPAATPRQARALTSETAPTAGEGEDAGVVDRGAIVADLVACREDLHELLSTATPEWLRARSNGTSWTNEHLLFHMVFGFLIVRRLLPLARPISSMPPRVGRGFASLLNAGRVPFHWVNHAGARGCEDTPAWGMAVVSGGHHRPVGPGRRS